VELLSKVLHLPGSHAHGVKDLRRGFNLIMRVRANKSP
jgi:hypothetical protein